MPLIFSVKKSNVPESVPGPNSFRSWSGKLGLTSFQLSAFEPGFHIWCSCSTVRHVAQVFCLLTTIAIPSFATVNAMERIPLSEQILFSEALIGRDAFARSISPRQKRSKPPPVPEMPTVTFTFLCSFLKPSAAAVV